jgi:outer membrane protein assembly factor BamB
VHAVILSLLCIAAALFTPGRPRAETVPALPSNWTMYQSLPSRNAVFALPDWHARWAVHTGGRIGGGLSVNGSTIYVESFDKHLYAIDARTGIVRWKAPLPSIAMNTPVVANGIVVVGTGNNTIGADNLDRWTMGSPNGDDVIGFDAVSGRPLWRWHTVGEDMPTGAIVLDGDRPAFLYSNGNGHVRALELSTGRSLWMRSMNGSAAMGSIAYDGALAFGTSNTFAKFILAHFSDAVAMAHRSWTWAIDAAGQYRWIAPYGNGNSSPAVGGGSVYVESVQYGPGETDPRATNWRGEVDALDEQHGTLLWQYRSPVGPFVAGPSNEHSIAGMYDRGVFFDSIIYTHSMNAFDARSGKVLWETPLTGVAKMSSIARDGYLFFGDSSGIFYVLREDDGTIVRALHFDKPFGTAPPVIVGDTMFIPNGPDLYAEPVTDVVAGKKPPSPLTD